MLTKSDAIITFIAFLGTLGSVFLVYRELAYGNACPDFFGIPACYLVLLAFFMVLVSVVAFRKLFFSVGTFIGLLLAVWFSVNHYSGHIICPVYEGIPLCYASLAAFGMILFFGLARKE